jgi:predicted DNA-binding transcriptional regulator YafY
MNSKHAHLRYNLMDYCFRNKSLTFEELLDYVNQKIADYYPGEGISTRALRADLKLFRNPIDGFNAPLPNNARILKYSNPNFSIADRPLLENEQYLIQAAQQLLERFENHPKYDKLAEALIKFQDEELQDEDSTKILFYDHNEEYKGIKHLKPLYFAIQKKHVLRITFKGFRDEKSTEYEFHPYVLKQYNNRWFVFGYNALTKNKKWSIPLDERLRKFEKLDDLDYKPSETNWDKHFRSMVGVRQESEQVVRVVLKFYNGREEYFKTKPFLPDFDLFFEKEKKDQVWFDTIINKELIQQILSYGKDVEVVEPITLVEQVKDHAADMNSYYNR